MVAACDSSGLKTSPNRRGEWGLRSHIPIGLTLHSSRRAKVCGLRTRLSSNVRRTPQQKLQTAKLFKIRLPAAGGWQDTEALLKCYQQPNNETLLAVMSEERKVLEVVSGA